MRGGGGPDVGQVAEAVGRPGRLDGGGERIIGTFQNTREGGRLVPADRRNRNEYRVAARDTGGAGEGELVVAEQPVRTAMTARDAIEEKTEM